MWYSVPIFELKILNIKNGGTNKHGNYKKKDVHGR